MTFHLTCVHIIFSSVWVAEWLSGHLLGNSCSLVDNMFSLYFDYLQFELFPVLVLRARFGF